MQMSVGGSFNGQAHIGANVAVGSTTQRGATSFLYEVQFEVP